MDLIQTILNDQEFRLLLQEYIECGGGYRSAQERIPVYLLQDSLRYGPIGIGLLVLHLFVADWGVDWSYHDAPRSLFINYCQGPNISRGGHYTDGGTRRTNRGLGVTHLDGADLPVIMEKFGYPRIPREWLPGKTMEDGFNGHYQLAWLAWVNKLMRKAEFSYWSVAYWLVQYWLPALLLTTGHRSLWLQQGKGGAFIVDDDLFHSLVSAAINVTASNKHAVWRDVWDLDTLRTLMNDRGVLSIMKGILVLGILCGRKTTNKTQIRAITGLAKRGTS